MSSGASTRRHGSRGPHMYASGAVSASSGAAPASRSAITRHKASAPPPVVRVACVWGRACGHALRAWLLKDTGSQRGGPLAPISSALSRNANGGK